MELRDAFGKTVIDGIASGSGLDACTRYKFLAFAGDLSLSLQEMVKLNITPAQCEQSHLFIELRHRRDARTSHSFEEPFAFAFLPLMPDRAFLTDGPHKLAVYRFHEQWRHSSGYLDCAALQNANVQTKVPQAIARLMVPTSDCLMVDSLLLSTQLTQDRSLLAILGLAGAIPENIDTVRGILTGMRFASEYESVKFLAPLMDVLLSLLVSSRINDDRLTDEVFVRLVNVLGEI